MTLNNKTNLFYKSPKISQQFRDHCYLSALDFNTNIHRTANTNFARDQAC